MEGDDNLDATAAIKTESAKSDDVDIPLSHPPPRSRYRKRKTLYEIAAERQRQLQASGVSPSSTVTPDDDDADDTLISRTGESFFLAVTLSFLHATLDVLVQHQYLEDGIEWSGVWGRLARMFPALWALVFALHRQANIQYLTNTRETRPRILGHEARVLATQLLFFVISTVSGCYMITMANTSGYYAVMKQAPPLGTLWVWAVVELRVQLGVVSLAITCIWMWWWGYSIF